MNIVMRRRSADWVGLREPPAQFLFGMPVSSLTTAELFRVLDALTASESRIADLMVPRETRLSLHA